MKYKAVSGMMLTLLSIGMLTFAFDFQPADSLEPPATEWTRTYGGTNIDYGRSVVQTSDGGYAIAGFTNSFGMGGYDFWLVKVDSSGNHQWNKTYGGTGVDWADSVVETSDGGYAIAGHTTSVGAGDYDFWLVKTDLSGNVQWSQTYGGIAQDQARSVVETSDGGYAIAGHTTSFGAGYYDAWLVKVDSSGNHQWNKTYGGAYEDAATSVVETSDGYALAGHTRSFGAGEYDFWLVKTDASGNMQWNKTYGGTNRDNAHVVVETSDGGYAITGPTRSFGAGYYDFWLVKVDSSGNMEWNGAYGGAGLDAAFSMVKTSDGGYAITGRTRSFGAGSDDIWLVKVAGVRAAYMNIFYTVRGVGPGGESPADYGFEVFIHTLEDLGEVSPEEILLEVIAEGATYNLSIVEVEIIGWTDGLFCIKARGHFEEDDPTVEPILGEYQISVKGSEPFHICELGDVPKDAPEMLYPEHGQSIIDTTPVFEWEAFLSEYLGELVFPWAYELNVHFPDDTKLTCWPIDGTQTSLDYLTAEWNSEAPPELSYGQYNLVIHSNHEITDGLGFQHHRIINFYVTPPPPAVGGKATPINLPISRLELLTPYIGLIMLLVASVVTVIYAKKRKKNT